MDILWSSVDALAVVEIVVVLVVVGVAVTVPVPPVVTMCWRRRATVPRLVMCLVKTLLVVRPLLGLTVPKQTTTLFTLSTNEPNA